MGTSKLIHQLTIGGLCRRNCPKCYNNLAYTGNRISLFGTEQTKPKAFLARHYSLEESERDCLTTNPRIRVGVNARTR